MLKTPEEYLSKVNSLTTRKELYEIGRQMQIDAYNTAIDDAVENAKMIEVYNAKDNGFNSAWEVTLDKQSILQLKK